MPENWIYLTSEPLTEARLRELALAFSETRLATPEPAPAVRVNWAEAETFGSVEREPEAITVSLYPLLALAAEHEPGDWAAVRQSLGSQPQAAIDITLLRPRFRSLLRRVLSPDAPDTSHALAHLFVSHLSRTCPGHLLHEPAS